MIQTLLAPGLFYNTVMSVFNWPGKNSASDFVNWLRFWAYVLYGLSFEIDKLDLPQSLSRFRLWREFYFKELSEICVKHLEANYAGC